MSTLNFDELYKMAIARWPSTIDANTLNFTSPDRYLVPLLDDAFDQILITHPVSSVAILTANMDDAIFSTLHAMAHTSVVLRLADLRADIVRADFEGRLKGAIAGDLRWLAEDLELAKSYFASNDASS